MPPLSESLLGETRWLRRLARTLVDDPEEAHDVVQDTMVRALQHGEREIERPRPFLATVLRNLVHDRRRRERRRPDIERRAARGSTTPAAGDEFEREVLRRTLVDLVLSLDEPYRSAMRLRFVDDLTPREVSERLQIPVETARTRLKRGVARIREQLDRRHGRRWAPAMLLFFPPLGGEVQTTAATGSGLQWLACTAAAAGIGAAVSLWCFARDEVTPGGVPVVAAPHDSAARAPLLDAKQAAVRDVVDGGVPALAPSVLRGQILDESTRLPVGGVELSWRGESAVLARTDGNGQFLARLSNRGARGPNELVARASGYAAVTLPIEESPAAGFDLGVVTIPPGTGIAGRVIDAEGLPVEGADVFALVDFEFSTGWPPTVDVELKARIDRAVPIGVTDRDGSFVGAERLVPKGYGDLIVAVSPRGVGWGEVSLRRERSERRAEIRLFPTVSLGVVATNAVGVPLADARVVLEPRFAPLGTRHLPRLDAEMPDSVRALFRARTDVTGLAHFDHVPIVTNGEYSLRVVAPGFMPRRIEPVQLGQADRLPLRVNLEPSRPIRFEGVVRDRTGHPVAGAAVVVRFGKTIATRADANGRYVVEGLPCELGAAFAFASCEGYESALRWQTLDGRSATIPLDLTLGDTELAQVERRDQPTGTTSVRVDLWDESGALLEAESAWLQEASTRSTVPVRLTIGRAEAEGLFPGTWRLNVLPFEGAPIERKFDVLVGQELVRLSCVGGRVATRAPTDQAAAGEPGDALPVMLDKDAGK